MLATTEARRAGYDEAILLTDDGYVADGPGENIFVVKDGVIRTPPLSTSILPGITRDSVITIAQDLGYVRRGDAADPRRPLPRGRGLHDRHRRRGDAGPRGRRPSRSASGPVTRELQKAYLDTVNGPHDRWAPGSTSSSVARARSVTRRPRGRSALVGALARRAGGGARARGAALGPALARAVDRPLRGAVRRGGRARPTQPPSRAAPPACTFSAASPASRPGDEVITSPYSFVASANCAIYEGATPVFADIDPRTLNLDPAAVEAAITPRTQAIVAVDIFGYPCELEELQAICERHGLALIDDACEALGARYKGRPLGVAGPAGGLRLLPEQADHDGRGRRRHDALGGRRGGCSRACATRAAPTAAAGSSTRGSASTTASTTSGPRSGSASSRSSTGSSRAAARSPRATTSCSPASTASGCRCADDADHVRSWFVYVVELPADPTARR